MSEYQYFEFQAVDRPLTRREMAELRAVSSRATITTTRFTNFYTYGDFKGNPAAWMEKYFDAFLYTANWGTHEFMLRLPKDMLDMDLARQYCRSEWARVRSKRDFVILEFLSEQEADDWEEEGEGWLSSLVPLRSQLAGGDHRALYLGWLLGVQNGSIADNEAEPAVPPGLNTLNAPLAAFADFLRIDPDLLAAAAQGSTDEDAGLSKALLREWIARLPDAEKIDLLLAAATAKDAHIGGRIRHRFLAQTGGEIVKEKPRQRTVGELRALAEQRAEVRREHEAAAAQRARSERERLDAEVRQRHLGALAKNEPETWNRVDQLIATKQPRRYDEAVRLLVDLREIGRAQGRSDEVDNRIHGLFEAHARKPSLLERMRKAGLTGD